MWHSALKKSAWLPARQNAAWEIMTDERSKVSYLKDHGAPVSAGVLWVTRQTNPSNNFWAIFGGLPTFHCQCFAGKFSLMFDPFHGS